MNKIETGKQYRTRDGRDARIYATDSGGSRPIHGAIRIEFGEWHPATWRKDGTANEGWNSSIDLIEVKQRHKRTVWINVYPDFNQNWVHGSKEDADFGCKNNRIACVRVDLNFEEGEGL